jgi:putative methionine-R-sulfoxide reductase with GAF domain
MTLNQNPKAIQNPANSLARLWGFLIDPHPSVQEIGEKRRAQLLAIITLILTVAYLWALISRPSSYNEFLALLLFTAIAYGLSRTPFYEIGTYFFSFGFTAFAYITLYLGTASSYTSAITTSVHISLVVASLLLSFRGLAALVLFVAIASATAPQYSHVPIAINSEFFRDTGVTVSMGVILLGVNMFRAYVERERLKEVNQINRVLGELTATLEQRVNERTEEIETANQQIIHRAAQLKAVTELSESIAQFQDLNEVFPATTRLISERFGFYHVGIFLVDQAHEFAILQAANSEGGKRMLERNHRLRLGVGVVGFSAQTGQPRIALDVGADAVFFNNPDLPDTRSEVALPMKVRTETIGVLDVQSLEAGAFSSEDIQVYRALAKQFSIAFELANLLN